MILFFTGWQIWQISEVALYERNRWAKFQGMLCGIVDGWLGRLGPIEKTRPRLAARGSPKNAPIVGTDIN
jgi:rhamnosyltransferase